MQQSKKSFIAVISGHIIEHYNVTLYGFYAVILSTVFFPKDNNINVILASFASFAIGSSIKPIGGIFFGHIGDKYGRKKALLTAIFLSSIPTIIIGFIPSYHSIGNLAPIILITSVRSFRK